MPWQTSAQVIRTAQFLLSCTLLLYVPALTLANDPEAQGECPMSLGSFQFEVLGRVRQHGWYTPSG